MDRALLGCVAELVRADATGPVADVGCGPGRITAHLHALGVPTFGIDLSPQMIAAARRSYPELGFEEGSMATRTRSVCVTKWVRCARRTNEGAPSWPRCASSARNLTPLSGSSARAGSARSVCSHTVPTSRWRFPSRTMSRGTA
ncbi:class I SAM-dependent methyltransferase [Haloechinothrix sp. LS1_15]|uniref:class I SAM-dependent methyltransferase n=1 Tax=Haloechinothrix sp. LS1_15 TaxID=2652248 RepID=UPI00294889C9|nr:class I SAM-dependent methyltransferase [Haloechinothrix sp. LS1_15]MDV6011113.1 class I SAM-dependent methyltransferase [Haloechinothrix sp. LS1_15]